MQQIGDIILINRQDCIPALDTYRYRIAVSKSSGRDQYRTPVYYILHHGTATVTSRHWFSRCKRLVPAISIQALKTIHVQNTYYFYVDLARGYYNGRYSQYRAWLASRIRNSSVLVLFNGYGPYMVYLSRANVLLQGVDSNPIAAYYCRANFILNGVRNGVVYTESAEYTLRHLTGRQVLVSILPLGIIPYLLQLRSIEYHWHYCLMRVNPIKLPVIAMLLPVYGCYLVSARPVKPYDSRRIIFGLVLARIAGVLGVS